MLYSAYYNANLNIPIKIYTSNFKDYKLIDWQPYECGLKEISVPISLKGLFIQPDNQHPSLEENLLYGDWDNETIDRNIQRELLSACVEHIPDLSIDWFAHDEAGDTQAGSGCNGVVYIQLAGDMYTSDDDFTLGGELSDEEKENTNWSVVSKQIVDQNVRIESIDYYYSTYDQVIASDEPDNLFNDDVIQLIR